jgi:HK97 family phage prohead protease
MNIETLKKLQIDTKSFRIKAFEIKEDSEMKTAMISGYGSIFNNEDFGGDVIEQSAFDKTLAEKGNNVYFFADHNYDMKSLLGFAQMRKDDKGLFGEYSLNLETEQGRNAYVLAKQLQSAGLSLGLSIGYSTVKADYDSMNQVRRIKEVKLYEISLVPFPMNENARVTDAKSEIELLKKEMAELKTLLKNEPDKSTQNDEAELVTALKQLHSQLKSK